MPGFSRDEQNQVSLLTLAHRRSLKKVVNRIEGAVDMRSVLALRLAVLFYRGRSDIPLPAFQARYHAGTFRLGLDSEWLRVNPLTATALREEITEWGKIGFELKIPGLGELEAGAEAVLVA